jgi:hypothetical protein
MLGGRCHFLQRLMQPFSFNPQPTARNLNKPPTILRLGVNRRSKTCKETSLVTCPTNTWKDWRGHLRWVTKQRMQGGRCHFLQRLMQLFSFNPQPTARNLNKPPTILRLGSYRRSKNLQRDLPGHLPHQHLERLARRPSMGHQTEDARGPMPLPRRWLRVKQCDPFSTADAH